MVTIMKDSSVLSGFHEVLKAKTRFASSPFVDEHEAIVRHGLPTLEDVDAATTEEERHRAYSVLIAQQRADFIAKYGDPHGMPVQTPPMVTASLKSLKNSLPEFLCSAV